MAKKVSELLPTDEVVVKLGAKSDVKDGKIITVEKAKQVIMTKAGFDAIELEGKDEDYSPTLGRTVELVGTPTYKEATDSMGGSIKELDKVEKLAKEATAPVA